MNAKPGARYGMRMSEPIRVLAPLVAMLSVAALGGAEAKCSGLRRALARVAERGRMGHPWQEQRKRAL